MRFFGVILSAIAFICALYNYTKSSRLLKKFEELDNAMFHHMMGEHNERIRANGK